MTRVVEGDALLRAIDMPTLLDEIARGFIAYSAGRAVVPPVGYLPLRDPRGDVHIKFGYIEGDDAYVVKIASGVAAPGEAGLIGDGMMLVFDRRTGAPRAILLDHAQLTDLRTAAAGAVAARLLAPRVVERVGIIGGGVQGRLQLLALAHVTPCRRALVHSRTRTRAEALVREARAAGWEAAVAESASEVARACDLIVTATAARAPLFPADALRAGAHVTAVGADAPGKQELDPTLFARAAFVVVDSRTQTADHGELAHALTAGTASMERVMELGEALADPTRAARRGGDITLCDLTGVAVQDIVIAEHVLRRLADG